jgi:hypothetical protein
MATSITTQENVLTYTTVTDNELSRLETDRMKADNWAVFHAQAWRFVLRMLDSRRPPIAEADLDDTDELLETVCYCVIYLAYDAADFLSEEDKKRRGYWWKKFRRAFADVRLTVDGAEQPQELYTNRRSIRG